MPPARPRMLPSARTRIVDALRPLALGLLLAVGAIGCNNDYIPNTDVEDTEEHRKVVAFCENYRHAVERKDIARLLQLTDPAYYEDGGNIDASDDIDFAGLKDYLVTKFDDAQSIRYEIRYRRVTITDERVLVDFTFSASYRIPADEGDDVWQRKVSDNRIELVPHNDAFRIIAGM
jgi:hypothetical protein